MNSLQKDARLCWGALLRPTWNFILIHLSFHDQGQLKQQTCPLKGGDLNPLRGGGEEILGTDSNRKCIKSPFLLLCPVRKDGVYWWIQWVQVTWFRWESREPGLRILLNNLTEWFHVLESKDWMLVLCHFSSGSCMSHRQGEDTVLLLEKLSFVFGLLHVQTPVLSTVVPPNCFSANIFNEGVSQT